MVPEPLHGLSLVNLFLNNEDLLVFSQPLALLALGKDPGGVVIVSLVGKLLALPEHVQVAPEGFPVFPGKINFKASLYISAQLFLKITLR